MSLFDTTLWGDLLPGGLGEAEGGEIDVTQVIDEILPTLHADSRANLHHWTERELLEYVDDCLKRLSRLACVFVGRIGSAVTVEGQATYPLPPRHVATLHVSHFATPLRPSNTTELEARDSDYATTPADENNPIAYWYQDQLAGTAFGVAAVPAVADEPLPIIYEGYPPTIELGQPLVAGPPPLKGYLAMFAIWRAYAKEGESEMPEVAAHCKARCELYETMMRGYYGPGM